MSVVLRVNSIPAFPSLVFEFRLPESGVVATATRCEDTGSTPSFLRRPPAVRGMPILRDTRDLNTDIPRNLRHENPPEFI